MEPQMAPSDEPHVKIRVGADGSIVVPATLSDVLGLKEGDVLFARVEDRGDSLVDANGRNATSTGNRATIRARRRQSC